MKKKSFSALNSYLQGENYNLPPYLGMCNGNMTCLAPPGSGCFAVRTEEKFYAFCGQTIWQDGVDGINNVKIAVASPRLEEASNCQNLANEDNSICYCDEKSYCNVPSSLMRQLFNGTSNPQYKLFHLIILLITNTIIVMKLV